MIGTDIIESVSCEIDNSDLAPDVCDRLRPCLPVLQGALDDWCASGGLTAPGLTIAAATPRGGTVVYSSRWGEGVDHLDRGVILAALHDAIELPASHEAACFLVACLTATLGPDGRAAAERDARLVTGGGELPLLVVLAAPEDTEVAVLVTTIALPCSPMLSEAIH